MGIQRLQWVLFHLQSVAHYMWLICGKTNPFFSAKRPKNQSGSLLPGYNSYVTILHTSTATTESESLDKGLEYVQIDFH